LLLLEESTGHILLHWQYPVAEGANNS